MSGIPSSAMRAQGGRERETMRAFGPLDADHPTVGQICMACGGPFEPGQFQTLAPLGPGADEDDQRKAREGGWYTCSAAVLHAACGGVEVPEG